MSRPSRSEALEQTSDQDKQACTKRRYEITQADLPLSCPPRDLPVWNAHPRVYLPIEETENGQFTCPYCDAEYILK